MERTISIVAVAENLDRQVAGLGQFNRRYMAEDTWMKCEREMFLTAYDRKYPLADKVKKIVREVLEKYNAHLVRSLFGESPYVAQNLKESIIKSRESEENGKHD